MTQTRILKKVFVSMIIKNEVNRDPAYIDVAISNKNEIRVNIPNGHYSKPGVTNIPDSDQRLYSFDPKIYDLSFNLDRGSHSNLRVKDGLFFVTLEF